MELTQAMRIDLIEDHDRKPRFFGVLPSANRSGSGYNPRCGDTYTVYLEASNGQIQQAQFKGYGCAVSRASASMMTESLQGLTVAQAKELLAEFRSMIAGESPAFEREDRWELNVFEGIHQNPLKHRCAGLAWEALEKALLSEP